MTFSQSLEAILLEEDRKQAFYDLIQLFCSSSDTERQYINTNWPFGKEWDTSDLTVPALNLSDGKTPEERIKAGLVLDLIYDDGRDLRDLFWSLGVLYNSALLAGLPADELFLWASHLLEGSCSRMMRTFAEPGADNSLENFGLKIVESPNGRVLDLDLF